MRLNESEELTMYEKVALFNEHMLTDGNTELSQAQIDTINDKLYDIMIHGCYYTDEQFIEWMQTHAERLYNALDVV